MGVLGFDPSLTSSGFAYRDRDGEFHTGRIKAANIRGPERLDFIRYSFLDLLGRVATAADSNVDLIAYEGYAMGGRAGRGRLFDIGELGGVLKLVAWQRGVDVLLIPPSNLKQFATGKGKADKLEVAKAIAETWGYNIPQNDEADAFILLMMGEAFLRTRRPRVSTKARALKGCQFSKGR